MKANIYRILIQLVILISIVSCSSNKPKEDPWAWAIGEWEASMPFEAGNLNVYIDLGEIKVSHESNYYDPEEDVSTTTKWDVGSISINFHELDSVSDAVFKIYGRYDSHYKAEVTLRLNPLEKNICYEWVDTYYDEYRRDFVSNSPIQGEFHRSLVEEISEQNIMLQKKNLSPTFDMKGTISTATAGITLFGDGKGSYFYNNPNNVIHRNTVFKSYDSSSNQLVIDGYDKKGNYVGTFDGLLINENLYKGVFTNNKGTKIDFYFEGKVTF